MADFEMTIQVAQDRKVTAIEIAPLGQSPQRLILALDELDKLIGELGNARSAMVQGQSPPDFESDDVTICTAANTKWHIRAFPPAGALLAFYHPKFGPVGFTLQRPDRSDRQLPDRSVHSSTDTIRRKALGSNSPIS